MTQSSINGGGEVVLYKAPDGPVQLDVRLEWEMVWLSQRQIALLFKTSTDDISLHLKNIYKVGELEVGNYRGLLGSSKRGPAGSATQAQTL
jgi:hypothetical protein